MDAVLYLSALLSAVLKQFPGTFAASRAVFAINGALLLFRLLRVYHVDLSLGPKLVILTRWLQTIYEEKINKG